MKFILQLLLNQFIQKPGTYVFPEHAPTRTGFRGLVKNDFDTCIGCEICSTICPSEAIKLNQKAALFTWSYDPGACTFCARCVDYCPVKALSMDPVSPPVYELRETLQETVEKSYPKCSECGRPALPVNKMVLDRVFSESSSKIGSWVNQCPECRQKLHHIELLDH